ncbi:MAG: hypothetical protein M0P12_09685, partial [Paludibacteraceae bacterium]|nr:hypothetical protein [Paludibacteraceae bacterium]
LRLAISLLIVDLFSFRKDNAIHEFWGIFLSLYQPHLSADPRLPLQARGMLLMGRSEKKVVPFDTTFFV